MDPTYRAPSSPPQPGWRGRRVSEGFLKIFNIRDFIARRRLPGVVVSRHLDDLDSRTYIQDFLGQLVPAQHRHDHVGNEQVKRLRGFGRELQGVDPTAGFDHPVAEPGELAGDKGTHVVFVFREQYAFRAVRPRSAHDDFRMSDSRRRLWQADVNRRPRTRRALDLNSTDRKSVVKECRSRW